MKKYRLKKDLPTFKAGMVFERSKQGNLIHRGECISDCLVAYSAQTLQKFPNIIRDWFEEIPEETKTVDNLKDGDVFYSISSDGFITTEQYHLDTQYDDDMRFTIGNAFLTKEEAKKELARRKAKQVLLRDTKGFKPDWHGEGNLNCTWTIKWERRYIDYKDARGCMMDKPVWKLTVNHADDVYDQNIIYFSSQEDVEASIKAHEKEWKTYLGVEK